MVVLGLVAIVGPTIGLGQVSVTDASGTFNAWVKPDGTAMSDPVGSNSGSATYDLVGPVLQKSGTIGGVDSILFRFTLDSHRAGGFNESLILGMDLDGNGSVDFFVKMTNGTTISYAAGTGTNTTPGNTTIGTWQTGFDLGASTYSYQSLPNVYGSGGPMATDASLTFAISFSSLQTAIQTILGGDFSSFVVNPTTAISFVAATTNSDTSFTRDIFGTTAGTTSTTTWTNLGAMTAPLFPDGTVPEPATYAQVGVLLLIGGALAWRRRCLLARKDPVFPASGRR